MNEILAKTLLDIPKTIVITRKIVQRAFRDKALQFHPDKNVFHDEEAFMRCKYARDFLFSLIACAEKHNTQIDSNASPEKTSTDVFKSGVSSQKPFLAKVISQQDVACYQANAEAIPMDIDSESASTESLTTQFEHDVTNITKKGNKSDALPVVEKFGQIRAIAFAFYKIVNVAQGSVTPDQILSFLKKNDLLVFRPSGAKLECPGGAVLFACEKASDSGVKSRIVSRMRYYPLHFIKDTARSAYIMSPLLYDRCLIEFGY